MSSLQTTEKGAIRYLNKPNLALLRHVGRRRRRQLIGQDRN
jgi:hypothetical protein